MVKLLGIIAFAAIIVFNLTGCGGEGSGRNFTNIGRVEDWLARQSGGASPDDPISFSVNVNLQNMAAPESNWHRLLTSINTAGLYVALDLSGSTMPGTTFDADGGITAGKQFIVSLVLPDSAQGVAGALISHFPNLRITRAQNIDYFVGDRGPGGGYIFFDRGYFADGWQFLEAAPASISGTHQWATRNVLIPNLSRDWRDNTDWGIGRGRINTDIILAHAAANGYTAPAALASVNYSNNGKTDWFLPSRDELNLMFQNLKRNNIGGFTNNWYWSSSQGAVYLAYNQLFGNGHQSVILKNFTNSVRAVRAF